MSLFKLLYKNLYSKLLVNGQWSYWREARDCSVTCGLGTRLRHRECSNPRPQYGGKLCTGKSVERDECFTTCAIGIKKIV